MTTKEMAVLNPEEYGVEPTRAEEIANAFSPMLKEMRKMELRYRHVIDELEREGYTKELIARAKYVRLEFVKLRTTTDKIHKKMKKSFLDGGRFCDGWKNTQRFAAQGMEEKLKEIEKHEEIEAEKRRVAFHRARELELKEFGVRTVPSNLGELTEVDYKSYKRGVELAYKEEIRLAEVALEKHKEAQRIEKEKKEKLLKDLEIAKQEKAQADLENRRLESQLAEAKKATTIPKFTTEELSKESRDPNIKDGQGSRKEYVQFMEKTFLPKERLETLEKALFEVDTDYKDFVGGTIKSCKGCKYFYAKCKPNKNECFILRIRSLALDIRSYLKKSN